MQNICLRVLYFQKQQHLPCSKLLPSELFLFLFCSYIKTSHVFPFFISFLQQLHFTACSRKNFSQTFSLAVGALLVIKIITYLFPLILSPFTFCMSTLHENQREQVCAIKVRKMIFCRIVEQKLSVRNAIKWLKSLFYHFRTVDILRVD